MRQTPLSGLSMLAAQLSYDLEDPIASEALLRSAVTAGAQARDPSIVDTLYRRGRVRRELMQYDEALIDFRTALESMRLFVRDNYEPPAYINKANVYLETARVHTLKGNVPLARYTLELAEKHANEGPYVNWADIHLERARLYRAEDDLRGAERELEYAMGHVSASLLDASLASIYLELGRIQTDLGDFEGAHFYLKGAYAAAHATSVLRMRIDTTIGDVYWVEQDYTQALGHYFRVRQAIVESDHQELPQLVEALAYVDSQLEEGRAHRHTLLSDLMDDLQVCVASGEGVAVDEVIRRVAVLARAYDDYERAKAMVLSANSKAAVALLAHRMLEHVDPLADEASKYEEDLARYSSDLADWERDLLDQVL